MVIQSNCCTLILGYVNGSGKCMRVIFLYLTVSIKYYCDLLLACVNQTETGHLECILPFHGLCDRAEKKDRATE